MLPRAYVAGPLGFTAAGRHWAATVLLPALRDVVEVVDPWTLSTADEFAVAAAEGRERSFGLEVGRRNVAAIDGASLLIAVLEGQELDSGTVAELGYACGRGMPCYALRTDLRRAGEPGMRVNLQVETFVVDSGGTVASSLDELVEQLRTDPPMAVDDTAS